MKDNIFISYSRSDSDFVIKLEEDLAKAGIFIWLDQKKISGGELWDRAIEEALGASGILILVVSPSSAISENVANEVQYAVDEGKKIVPIIIEQTKVPLTWRRYQRIDFVEDYETGLNNLVRTLKFEIAHMQDNGKENGENGLSVEPVAEEAPQLKNVSSEEVKTEERRAEEHAEQTKKEKEIIEVSGKTTETTNRKKSGYKIPVIVAGVIAVIIIVLIIVISGNKYESYPVEADQTSDVQNNDMDENAWKDALTINTIESYQAYQQNYSNGLHFNEAQNKIDEIVERNDWQTALTLNTKQAYQSYLDSYPTGTYVAEARTKIADLDAILLRANQQQQIAKPEVNQEETTEDIDENVLKAESVRHVEYLVGASKGVFIQTGPLKWEERNSDGVFAFDERTRDEWSVYLFDPDRNVSIQLDLYKMEILYEGSLIYNISSYSDSPD